MFKVGDRVKVIKASCCPSTFGQYIGDEVVLDNETNGCSSQGFGLKECWFAVKKGFLSRRCYPKQDLQKIGGSMKYDKETTQAIRDSIAHHEDNLHKLKTLKGEFYRPSSDSHFFIGGIKIPFDTTTCALCKKFRTSEHKKCKNCPLKITEGICGASNTTWSILSNATTSDQAITAEENMVKVLKGLLGEEEFKVEGFEIGDKVRITDYSCQENFSSSEGKEVEIITFGKMPCNCPTHPNTFFDVEIKIGNRKGWFKSKYLQKVEKVEEKPMNQYDSLKQRIEKVTTLLEADNIMQEIMKAMPKDENKKLANSIETTIWDYSSVGISIKTCVGATLIYFPHNGQCEKLEAFKKALMWLLEHSSIKDEKKEEIEKVKEEMGKLQERLDKLT